MCMRVIKVHRFTREGSTVLEMLEPDAERAIEAANQMGGFAVNWNTGRQVTVTTGIDEIAIVEPIAGG